MYGLHKTQIEILNDGLNKLRFFLLCMIRKSKENKVDAIADTAAGEHLTL